MDLFRRKLTMIWVFFVLRIHEIWQVLLQLDKNKNDKRELPVSVCLNMSKYKEKDSNISSLVAADFSLSLSLFVQFEKKILF